MSRSSQANQRYRRRGGAAVMTAISITTLVGFTALAVDVSMLYNTRAELQRSADAAAMAGAAKLLDNSRLKDYTNPTTVINSAITQAGSYASMNKVLSSTIQAYNGDIKAGYLSNPYDLTQALDTSTPMNYNSVYAYVARSAQKNGSVALWFGQIFGLTSTDLSASATATYEDGVIGYKVTGSTGNADLLPLALHVNVWNLLVSKLGTGSGTDNYTYNASTGTVSAGADGIPELNLYPGSGATQLPPGNFGTVNIGPSNNSTSHLSSQIRYGVTAEDLSYFGGELKLSSDGTLLLNGDTGLSAAIKDDLVSILGKGRAIPLFNYVTGPGENSMFTIVGFGGIRIMNVTLTGSMSTKNVVIQPAFVVDDAAVIDSTVNGSGGLVYQPLRLTR